jgi:hypothetical protein
MTTVARRLVGPPTKERRRVAEAVAFQVVVLHLADALGAQWLPREVLLATLAALRARHPLRVADDGLGPVAPWMLVQRAVAERRELVEQLPGKPVIPAKAGTRFPKRGAM